MQKLKFLRPAISLVVITVGIALLLSLVNFITKDKIAENELQKKNEAIADIFGDGVTSEEKELSSPIETVSSAGKVLNSDGSLLGYWVQVEPVGFKANIVMIIGFDTNDKIVGVRGISSSETAGLGTKATSESHLNKFIGAAESDVIDTVSGATISSKAVQNGIDNAFLAVKILKEVK